MRSKQKKLVQHILQTCFECVFLDLKRLGNAFLCSGGFRDLRDDDRLPLEQTARLLATIHRKAFVQLNSKNRFSVQIKQSPKTDNNSKERHKTTQKQTKKNQSRKQRQTALTRSMAFCKRAAFSGSLYDWRLSLRAKKVSD